MVPFQKATSPRPQSDNLYWHTFVGLADVLAGGLIFWTPTIVVHWIRGRRFSGRDAMVLILLMPVLSCLTLFGIWKTWPGTIRYLHRAMLAVLGIWLLGPMMISISFSFSGGGFAQRSGWSAVALETVLFPVFTFIMSSYDGTLFAVLLATVCLLVLGKRSQHA
jgi:hypothetical protein